VGGVNDNACLRVPFSFNSEDVRKFMNTRCLVSRLRFEPDSP
jgi:hypothetical protein